MAHCSASRLRSLCHLWEAGKTHRAWQHAITWELCRERNRMMLKYETILLRATSDNHQAALIAPAVNSGFSCKETFFHYDRSFRISCSHLVRSMWRAQKGSICIYLLQQLLYLSGTCFIIWRRICPHLWRKERRLEGTYREQPESNEAQLFTQYNYSVELLHWNISNFHLCLFYLTESFIWSILFLFWPHNHNIRPHVNTDIASTMNPEDWSEGGYSPLGLWSLK